MIESADALRARVDEFREVCKTSGIRLTHQRLVIFQEAVNRTDHPDAETVYRAVRKRVPTVSLDTVYRTLWMLSDLGLIGTLRPPHESVRFDANTSPHHHFVCTRCGITKDLGSREFDALRLTEDARSIGNVEAVRVEVHGVCHDCAKTKSE